MQKEKTKLWSLPHINETYPPVLVLFCTVISLSYSKHLKLRKVFLFQLKCNTPSVFLSYFFFPK